MSMFVAVLAVPASSATYDWECDGVVSNAYLSTSPGYRELQKAKHVINISCPMLHTLRGVACEASIDGRIERNVWYDDKNLTSFDSIGTGLSQFDPRTGYFTYKITEGDVNNTAETQLWFSAHCKRL